MQLFIVLFCLTALCQACTFEDSGQRLGHAASHHVALVDIDGDGLLDAVVANRASPSVVWRNTGHGTFSPYQELRKEASAGLNEYTWAVAALVGTNDIALLGDQTRSTSANHIWRQDHTTGGYVPLGSPLPVVSVRGAVSADFNGDGRPDLATVGLEELSVLLMGTDGQTMTVTFRDPTVLKSYGVATADVNGDGKLDLVVTRTAGPNDLYLGDGNGSFSLLPDRFPGSSIEWTRGVALGDLNGDGHLDAVFANRALGRVPASTVWFGDGSGSFTDSGQRLEARADSYEVVLADVDKDGDLDAVLGNWFANVVLKNNGRGVFSVSSLAQTSSFGTFGVAVGDLRQTGYPDLFFADNNGGGDGAPNTVWLNQCHGPPPPPPPPTITTTGGLPPPPGPDETEGETVVLQFQGKTPSASLIPVDHCGQRHDESAFMIRFDTAVERDPEGNALKTVDFGTSSFTYVRPDTGDPNLFRFDTRAHDTDFTFDVALFDRDALVSLDAIMGNVSFEVARDTFKWSIGMSQWPFWGDDVEQHILELRVRVESADGPVMLTRPEPVADSDHVLRYDVETTNTKAALRVLDVANVDGRPTKVAHSLDLGKGQELRALVFVFPRFRSGVRFDPDVSILLRGDDKECGGENRFTQLMAIGTICIPICVILVIGALATTLLAQRARHWWDGRHYRRARRKSINLGDGVDEEGFVLHELEDMQDGGAVSGSSSSSSSASSSRRGSEDGEGSSGGDASRMVAVEDKVTGSVFLAPADDDDPHAKED